MLFLIYFSIPEILPLVEFILPDDISDLEAVRLIETPPTDGIDGETWKQEISDDQQTLHLDSSEDDERDPFTSKLEV